MQKVQGGVFFPYQPSLTYGLTDYSELTYCDPVAMVFYQFETKDKDETVIIVPDGCVDILFCCDKVTTTATVYGSVLKGETFTFSARRKYFGARILPCSCLKVLNRSVQTFINKQIPLVDVLSDVYPMLDKITFDSDFNDIINLVTGMICLNESTNKKMPQSLKYVLKHIVDLNGDIKLERLAEEIGYSTRHFSKIFQDNIGINPKLFCRIIRFQHSLEHLFAKSKPNLAELVKKLHYYDESHLLRDYHYFCQNTPHRLIQKTISH